MPAASTTTVPTAVPACVAISAAAEDPAAVASDPAFSSPQAVTTASASAVRPTMERFVVIPEVRRWPARRIAPISGSSERPAADVRHHQLRHRDVLPGAALAGKSNTPSISWTG